VKKKSSYKTSTLHLKDPKVVARIHRICENP
jgi:hypothetical protein